MIEERSQRRKTFQEGTSVQLADGQTWWLPSLETEEHDPVLDSLRRGLGSAHPEPERLRDELAATILLLSRNYQLSPDAYPKLLGFQPGDPARGQLQRTIRQVLLGRSYVPRVELIANVDRRPGPSRRWAFSAASKTFSKVRSRWTARSQ